MTGPTRTSAGARPRGSRRLATGALVALLLGAGAGPAWAWFGDDAGLATQPTTATTVLRPDSAGCTEGAPLPLSATVAWPAKDSRYEYEVTLRRTTAPAAVVGTRVVSGTSTTYAGLVDFGLVVGAGTVDFTVDVRSRLVSAPSWTSADVRSYSSVRVLAVAVGATVMCTT